MSALPSELVSLSPETRALYRRRMEKDPWYFVKYVSDHAPREGERRPPERIHRPLLYVYTRQAALLCATLSDPRFDGPITDAVREDFKKHGVNWDNPSHLPRAQKRLRKVNIRLPRGVGKSTIADDGDLWEEAIDPNLTISLGTKSDTYAWERIEAMGKIVMSPAFAFWFPERVPLDPKHDVTKTGISLNGRTTTVPEAGIEGRGINSPWTGRHYRKNRRDDIVGTESGDASVEDAKRHMSNMSALRDDTGWQGDLYIGTINGENDDHAILSNDETVLTITMAIEEHEGGTTLENVYSDGVLTVPEWWDRDKVNEIKAEARTNPAYGPIYLLQNYYMCAHKSGSNMFSNRLLASAQFRWVYDDKLKRDLIYRPKKGCEKTERDEKKPGFRPQDWFCFDFKKSPRTAAAWAGDQSVSADGSADQWSLSGVLVDCEGVYYVLENEADRGYDHMLESLLPFDRKMGKPNKNGLDANATQSMTIDWIKRSAEFRDIARRIFPIRSGGEAKDINIRNWIQARMLTGELYINPRLFDLLSEMSKYRPRTVDGRKKKNAVDNRLDATWMAMTLPIVPPSAEAMEEMSNQAMLNRHYESIHTDRMTGVSTDDWMDALPQWSAA